MIGLSQNFYSFKEQTVLENMQEPKPAENTPESVKNVPELKLEYDAKEWAEILGISERTFKRLISEAKIKESSVVDGVPQYKLSDVHKYIVIHEKLSLYIRQLLYFSGADGASADGICEAFCDAHKSYSFAHEEYYFGERLENLRERIRDILKKGVRRRTLLKVVRDGKLVYILPRYATPEQKEEAENRRNTIRAKFYFNPVNKYIKSTIPLKKGLDKKRIEFLQAIRTYVDTALWLNGASSQNEPKR